MRKKSLIVIGLVLVVAFSLQSCSSSPERGLLKKYFNAVRYNDNATMSSMALEPLTMDITGFDIVSVSPEKVEPANLPELNAKEAELKKKLEDHVGPTIDAKDTLDVAKEELDTARTKAAKAAAQKKVDELQAKYDQELACTRTSRRATTTPRRQPPGKRRSPPSPSGPRTWPTSAT